MTETDGSQGLFRRHVVSWIGLILLAFNVLGAGSMPAQAEGTTPLFAQELLGDRIVICTAAGMVVMDRDGNILDTQGPSAHTSFCVYCLPLMHGGVQAPAVIALAVLVEPVETQAFLPAEQPAPRLTRPSGTAQPRAPPLA